MRLHWSPRSPFVRKVMVAAYEVGLADDIQTVRTVVALDRPHHGLLTDNPLSKIPTLVLDDGSAIHDSLTICEYLDHLGGGTLFPEPGPDRWTALTRHALANGLLDAAILWRFELGKPAETRTQTLLDAWALKTTATLDRLEAMAPALHAGPFGIGQITIAILLSYLDFRFAHLAWRRGRPALAAWHALAAARPSMLATAAEDD